MLLGQFAEALSQAGVESTLDRSALGEHTDLRPQSGDSLTMYWSILQTICPNTPQKQPWMLTYLLASWTPVLQETCADCPLLSTLSMTDVSSLFTPSVSSTLAPFLTCTTEHSLGIPVKSNIFYYFIIIIIIIIIMCS